MNGPWKVSFPEKLGAPASVPLSKRASFHEHSDTGVKYFSGTATYSKQFTLNEVPKNNKRIFLDLGEVAVIAEVSLNGKPLGTWRKPPFMADITEAVKNGINDLEIKLTNLWSNRLIGD